MAESLGKLVEGSSAGRFHLTSSPDCTLPNELPGTPAEVEAALVEAQALWRRSPGGGRWPFAGDGPWHLIRKEWWDWDAREAAAMPVLPLSVRELARRDGVSAWIAHAPERDRRLVVLVIAQLWQEQRSQPDFMALRAAMGVTLGADGLRMRYNRALSAIVRALHKVRAGERNGIPG